MVPIFSSYLLFPDPRWTLEGLAQLRALPSGLQPKHLSFFHDHHICDFCWSLLLVGMFLFTLACIFSQGNSHCSRTRILWRCANDLSGSKPVHPRTSGWEVSGSCFYLEMKLFCATRRTLGIHKQTETQEDQLEGSSAASEKGMPWSADSQRQAGLSDASLPAPHPLLVVQFGGLLIWTTSRITFCF